MSQLFPPTPVLANGSQTFNPLVVSSVQLPNNQTYQFRYNAYGELARVSLPTGGAIEYDYAAGVDGDAASGVTFVGTQSVVYRRVVKRRVYLDGTTGSLEGLTTYSKPESLFGSDLDYVLVDHYKPDGTTRLAQEKHYYDGKATDSFNLLPYEYSPWKHGREKQTESVDTDGETVLWRKVDTWQQRPAVTWFDPNLDGSPPNDPRIAATTTTWVDTNQVSKKTFDYDDSVPYNNQKDIYEYDFGSGAPSTHPTRHTHIDYVTTLNGANYAGDTNIHLRSLPLRQIVYTVNPANGAETWTAQTEYEYDRYDNTITNHALLWNRLY